MLVKGTPFLLGLFILCACTLMLQIIETRILSVLSMYYLAFLSISMAMLGMTVGALLVYFNLSAITPSNIASYLSRISATFALTIVVGFLLQLASPLVLIKGATLVLIWARLIILVAAPFVVAGVAVSLALTRSPCPIGLTYGVDLLGAAFGCLVVLLLLNLIDAPSAMFAVAAMAALAGMCFRAAGGENVKSFPNSRILQRPGRMVLALLALTAANAATRYGLQPVSAKFGIVEANTKYEFEKWNTFSRVAVGYATKSLPFLWGPSSVLPYGLPVDQRGLNIDGFAGTTMPRFTGNFDDVNFLKYDITNLVYAARDRGRAAVIGVGSGRDLLSAYLFGFRDITGVELNPAFIGFLTDPLKMRSYAGIADVPGIHLVVDEGRSWFARTQQKFDVIEMSMIDTFASTGAGAFSLAENGLYTVEAWRIFLSDLTPTGLFTVSRWHSPSAPIEIGRTASLAIAALYSIGVQNPRDHIFIASVKNLATVIVSRQALSDTDLSALNGATERLNFNVLAQPGQAATDPVFQDLLSATSIDDLDSKAGQYWLDMSPPTDARPFFFNQLRVSNLQNLRSFADEYGRTGSFTLGESLVVAGNVLAIGTLFLLILLSLLAVVLTVILPARSSVNRVEPRFAALGSIYFLLIGLGFMFIEIGLIQRMSVFMGHPVYALSIVLFSIILSTGLGSLLSGKFVPSRPREIILWLGLLVLYLLFLPYWLPVVTHSFESSVLLNRAAVCVAVILPAGILMGFGFPIGMRLATAVDARATPWFWGVNGAAGVLAAGLAVACSIGASIDTTVRVGAICYLLLVPIAILLLPHPGTPESKILIGT
jgi:hypothetical protein